MDTEALALLTDLQFTVARILWAPYCDRDRAIRLAELAAQRHPNAAMRAAIQTWLDQRKMPPIDEIALAHLEVALRASETRSSSARAT